jgi:serine/threonine protein kinase
MLSSARLADDTMQDRHTCCICCEHVSGCPPERAQAMPGGNVTDDIAPAWVTGGFVAGSRISGYRLEEQIGRGGMAVVFRAHDERLNRQVALKILAPTLAADEEFRRRFIRESQAAAAVDDPNIHPGLRGGRGERRAVHRDAARSRR